MADLLNERKIISRENQEIFLQKRSGEIPYKEEEKEEDRYVSREEEKRGGGARAYTRLSTTQHKSNEVSNEKSILKVIWGKHGKKKALPLQTFNTGINRVSGKHYLSFWSKHWQSWNCKWEHLVRTSRFYRITCRQLVETIELKRGKVFSKLALG